MRSERRGHQEFQDLKDPALKRYNEAMYDAQKQECDTNGFTQELGLLRESAGL